MCHALNKVIDLPLFYCSWHVPATKPHSWEGRSNGHVCNAIRGNKSRTTAHQHVTPQRRVPSHRYGRPRRCMTGAAHPLRPPSRPQFRTAAGGSKTRLLRIQSTVIKTPCKQRPVASRWTDNGRSHRESNTPGARQIQRAPKPTSYITHPLLNPPSRHLTRRTSQSEVSRLATRKARHER